MKAELRSQVEGRLGRIAGQISGLERMVEADRYCVDVLIQVAAARAALDRLGKLILAGHVETCIADAFSSGTARERKKKLDELLDVFSRFGGVDAR